MKGLLRAVRAAHARVFGAILAAVPQVEPAFIATGRWIAPRSHLVGTLYWCTQDDLLRRARASGRRFRLLPVAGLDLRVDITDGTGRMHYFYGEPYEPEMSAAIRRLLAPGDVFLDVGANIGYFSVLAGAIVGSDGHVAAFEPHPVARATLRAAIAINGLSGVVEVVEAAVGSADGTIALFLSSDPVLSTLDPARSPARDQFAFDRSIEVRQITLDTWLSEHPHLAPGVRAIKIDVEGTEADVVTGMRRTLAACPGAAILCETEAGSAADRVLRDGGYAGSVLDVRRGSFGNYLYERTRTMC